MEPKPSVLITAAGEIKHIPPNDGERYSLEELEELVGGLAETHATPHGMLLVMDEAGKLKDKPVNLIASEMMHRDTNGDEIVGDVIYCHPSLVR